MIQLQKKLQHFLVIACVSWLFNFAEFTLIDCMLKTILAGTFLKDTICVVVEVLVA